MNKKFGLDLFRFIVSFLIIAIHISPFMSFNHDLDFIFTRILCRIGVPLFLMISGYFVLPQALNNRDILKKYTWRILKYYLFCIILYLPVTIYSNHLNLNLIDIIKHLLFEGTFYHLWYFPALVLGIWFTYFLCKNYTSKSVKIILFILYIVGLLGDSYYGLVQKSDTLIQFYNIIFAIFGYTRNGLFYVPIFLYLGYQSYSLRMNIKNDIHIVMILTCILFLIVEGSLVHHLHFQRHDSMYIMLLPTMFFLFQFLLKNNYTVNKKCRNMATTIYISHPMVLIFIRLLAKIFNIWNIMVKNTFAFYMSVSFLTFLIAYFFEKMKGSIQNAGFKFIKRSSMD